MQTASGAAPRYTILLPTHNRADVPPFALRSVLAQTVQDFELLIVGDGCTDRTAEVVASFADARIRWFDLPKAPNFGYANRNIALRTARGELIAYMTHDDIWLPDHLERLGGHFAAPHIDFAYSRTLWVARDGTITPSAFNLHDPATRQPFLAMEANSISATCVVHRRTCLDRHGYWDETLPRNGDWDMWRRIISGGGERTFVYEPEPTCLHFRAIWKIEATAGPYELYVWQELRARGILPPALASVPVEPGQTEQATTWAALAADPAGWSRALRGAVHQEIDHCVGRAELLIDADNQRRQATHLDQVVAVKDQHIANLDGALALKDHHIANIEQALGTKDQHVANLDGAIALKDRHIANLTQAIGDKDQHIAHLARHQAAQDQRIAQDAHERGELSVRLGTATAALAAGEQHAARLALALATTQSHIARIESRLPVRLYRRLRRLLPPARSN